MGFVKISGAKRVFLLKGENKTVSILSSLLFHLAHNSTVVTLGQGFTIQNEFASSKNVRRSASVSHVRPASFLYIMFGTNWDR